MHEYKCRYQFLLWILVIQQNKMIKKHLQKHIITNPGVLLLKHPLWDWYTHENEALTSSSNVRVILISSVLTVSACRSRASRSTQHTEQASVSECYTDKPWCEWGRVADQVWSSSSCHLASGFSPRLVF